MRITFLLLFLGLSLSIFGQETYPKDYFQNPVRVPLYLAGNFGELRANHFHSGLDIKTQQRVGLDILAAADGYISRINKNPYGYGNVMYVQHPNGYTTVYAHLQEFSPTIEAYMRKHMYSQEKNNLELYPRPDELPVKQGEVIAKSGETGSVAGPHLHYEIRDGRQRTLNPFLFGVQVKDSRPPHVSGLYVYSVGPNSHVDQSSDTQELHFTKQADGSLKTEPIHAFGKLGFGVAAVDYMDDVPNTNGMYKITTRLNGSKLIDFTFDSFSFTNSRYINRHIDYAFFEKNKKRIQKLFIEPNNHIDMQITHTDNGYLNIKEDLNYNYEIILKDFAGNETKIIIPIKAMELPEEEIHTKEPQKSDYFAQWNKPNVFNLDHHDIYIPKEALYDDVYLNIEEDAQKISIHDPSTPLHKDITIGFDAGKYSKEDREKLYVARVYPNGRSYYSKTYKDGARITTKTRSFGEYKLKRDTISPLVTPVNFQDKQWVSSIDFLKVRIKDDDSGISHFRGTINGKFIVLEYDYKRNVLQYDFRDGISSEGQNDLKIIVTDNVGNHAVYEATFFRKS